MGGIKQFINSMKEYCSFQLSNSFIVVIIEEILKLGSSAGNAY